MTPLSNNSPAPAFSLSNQEGVTTSLADFAGKKLLLYFYPKADTPGCTAQACAVRDALADLAQHGVAAVGVSPDKPKAQQKFYLKYGLGFPLLADEHHTVADAYGVWAEKSMYGKKYMGITRSAFLINEQGIITHAWYGISPNDTVPKVMEALGVS